MHTKKKNLNTREESIVRVQRDGVVNCVGDQIRSLKANGGCETTNILAYFFKFIFRNIMFIVFIR